jgi:hypothetical protein
MIKQSKFSKYLHGGEACLNIYHSHPATYLGSWSLGGLLILASFFLLWPLLTWGQWGLTGWLVLLLSGLLVIGRAFILWRGNVLLFTNHRLIDINRSGLISQTVSQVAYQDIQDVSWSKHGLGAAIFGYGSVQLVCAGGSIRLVFDNLSDASEVSAAIVTARKSPPTGVTPQTTSGLTGEQKNSLVKEIYSDASQGKL